MAYPFFVMGFRSRLKLTATVCGTSVAFAGLPGRVCDIRTGIDPGLRVDKISEFIQNPSFAITLKAPCPMGVRHENPVLSHIFIPHSFRKRHFANGTGIGD